MEVFKNLSLEQQAEINEYFALEQEIKDKKAKLDALKEKLLVSHINTTFIGDDDKFINFIETRQVRVSYDMEKLIKDLGEDIIKPYKTEKEIYTYKISKTKIPAKLIKGE